MNNYRQKIRRSVALIVICYLVLMQFPRTVLARFYNWLFLLRSPAQWVRFVFRGSQQSINVSLLILAANIIMLVSIVRLIYFLVKASLERNGTSSSDVRPARSGRTGRTKADVTFRHSTGSDHYMEQLDSFLQSGIITKEEYLVLRSRHSKRQ